MRAFESKVLCLHSPSFVLHEINTQLVKTACMKQEMTEDDDLGNAREQHSRSGGKVPGHGLVTEVIEPDEDPLIYRRLDEELTTAARNVRSGRKPLVSTVASALLVSRSKRTLEEPLNVCVSCAEDSHSLTIGHNVVFT